MISIIVPVYNEEECLAEFYTRLVEAIQGHINLIGELIFVDDGSTDDSFEILNNISCHVPAVKVIKFVRNFGEHVAIAAGLDVCKGDAAIIMGADLQDSPEAISEFIKKWEQGYHIVWASRSTRSDPFIRRILASIFYGMVRKIALPGYPKSGTGSFCLVDRKVIDVFKACQERNRVTFGIISWSGYSQCEVPFERGERFAGKSKYNIIKMIKIAVDTMASFSYLPVRFGSYMGLGVSFLSFIGILYVLIQKFVFGALLEGWASLMVVIMFLGGIQLIVLGILGEYIWRTHEESKYRPLYIISERVGW